MKILLCASEAVPYAKTGGLADVVSALALALAANGQEVRIVLPRYYSVDRAGLVPLKGAMGVPMGGVEEWCAVYSAELPASPPAKPIPVYFIDHEIFFGRDGIYGTQGEPDFLDNPRRFAFFSRAVFQLCRKIGWTPDIFHAHDWPAAMVPVFLKFIERKRDFAGSVSVLTVHNLGYQGIYNKQNYPYTGLGWDVFYEAGFDDWNMMNILKSGLMSADRLNTVSPTYAKETETHEHGFRLDGVLRYRAQNYTGILNGIDAKIWNPARDPFLPKAYSAKDMSGKKAAKERLQKEFALPLEDGVPVIGMVTRLTGQKGVGELFGPTYGSAYAIARDMALQFVVLGSGESWCEYELKNLASKRPNFKVKIGYSEELSHLIEAGSDFFLMPSRYEPCGLNQMYSMAYGTLPIVRNTGGLADTVQNFNQDTGEGTGFMFDDLTPQAIYNTVGWAVWAYYNKRDMIEEMRVRGMGKDFSWEQSAKRYISMYEDALGREEPFLG